MLTKFQKTFNQICESINYTIHTIEKGPYQLTIDGKLVNFFFKVTELIDPTGEIKSADPIYESLRLESDQLPNAQEFLLKYKKMVDECIADVLSAEAKASKKKAKKDKPAPEPEDEKQQNNKPSSVK